MGLLLFTQERFWEYAGERLGVQYSFVQTAETAVFLGERQGVDGQLLQKAFTLFCPFFLRREGGFEANSVSLHLAMDFVRRLCRGSSSNIFSTGRIEHEHPFFDSKPFPPQIPYDLGHLTTGM